MSQKEFKSDSDNEDFMHRTSGLLSGKVVSRVYRHRLAELIIEFQDGTKLFVDRQENQELDLSITEGERAEE